MIQSGHGPCGLSPSGLPLTFAAWRAVLAANSSCRFRRRQILDAHASDAGDCGTALIPRNEITVAGADAAQDRIVGTPAVRIGLGRIECGTGGENAEGCKCHPRELNHDSTSWAAMTNSCPIENPTGVTIFPKSAFRQPLIQVARPH